MNIRHCEGTYDTTCKQFNMHFNISSNDESQSRIYGNGHVSTAKHESIATSMNGIATMTEHTQSTNTVNSNISANYSKNRNKNSNVNTNFMSDNCNFSHESHSISNKTNNNDNESTDNIISKESKSVIKLDLRWHYIKFIKKCITDKDNITNNNVLKYDELTRKNDEEFLKKLSNKGWNHLQEIRLVLSKNGATLQDKYDYFDFEIEKFLQKYGNSYNSNDKKFY